MDGRSRGMDDIFIECLWKTVKYQEGYLKAYASIIHAKKEYTKFFDGITRGRPTSASTTGPRWRCTGARYRKQRKQYEP